MAEKIGYLDGLRGLAAFTVVFFHFFNSFYPALYGAINMPFNTGFEWLVFATPLNIFINGQFAVCIFFVLSGYVLTYKFYKTGDQRILSSGAIRRYFRLLPPVAFSVICFLAFIAIANNFIHYDQSLTGESLAPTRSVNIMEAMNQAFIYDFTIDASNSGITLYNAVLWTMAIEFIGSMIVFSFASLFGKSRNRWVFYLAGAYVFASTFYLAFIIGALLADMTNSGDWFRTIRINNVHKSILSLIMLMAGIFLASNNGHLSYGSIYQLLPGYSSHTLSFVDHYSLSLLDRVISPMVLGAGFLVTGVLWSDQLKKFLSAPVFIFLGVISFSLYLMHSMIISSFSYVLFDMAVSSLHVSYGIALVSIFAISLIPIFIVAYLVYKYVDRPGIKFSRQIYDNLFESGSKPTDWKLVGKEARSFIRKNVALIVVSEILIIIYIGCIAFIVNPQIEQKNAILAVSYYNDDLDATIASYNSLAAYPSFNNTSGSSYKTWLDGYEERAFEFSYNYYSMKNMGESNKRYYNSSMQEKIARDISFYGVFMNETKNKTTAYEMADNIGNWNNTLTQMIK